MVKIIGFYQVTKAHWEASMGRRAPYSGQNILASVEDLPKSRHIGLAVALGTVATFEGDVTCGI
jgi:hypothetical protein